MRRVKLLLLVFLFTALAPVPCVAKQKIYRAALSGSQEVPRVKTPAKGNLKLTLSDNVLTFELNVKRITSPTSATIHRGRKGENGPPVAGLFGGPKKVGGVKGMLAHGAITEKHLLGELEGKTTADLVELINSGDTYVNILTETYPAGEIRGQIR